MLRRPIPIEEMVRQFKISRTTSHMFKIDNFSLLKKYEVERVESSVFDLGGHKWKLIVYPSGNDDGNCHVSVFLENQFPINVMLEYEVFVVSQIERIWHSAGKFSYGTSSIKKTRGNKTLMPLDDLEEKGYLIGDCCMFGVKLYGIEPAKSGTAECFSLIEKPLNYKVTWMMAKFSSFDPKKAHRSNEFVVGNRKWQIEIHPRGYSEEKDKSFSVYLCEVGFIDNVPNAKTYAKYKYRVLDQVNRNHVEKGGDIVDFDKGDEKGFADFMPLKKLDEPYLMNDKLYVGVEFEVISVTNYC